METLEKPKLNKSEFYAEHIQKWQQSGMPQEKYCKSVNVSYPAFVYWRIKLSQGKKRMVRVKKKFLPLKPIKQLSTANTQSRYMMLTLSNGIKLSFPLSINSTMVVDCIKTIEKTYDNTEF